MEDRKIYYFRRDHNYGFDEIKILAFNEDQANIVLNDTVKNFSEWYLKRRFNIDKMYDEMDSIEFEIGGSL